MTTTSAWRQSTVAEEFEVQLGKRLDAAVNRGELKTCINNRGVRWGRVQVKEAILAPLTRADVRDLRLNAGDVLMCEGGEIGRSSVWNSEISEAYFLNTLHRLRSKGQYNPKLLVAFFERWADTGELSAVVGKATLAHLTKENLLRVPLPAPVRAEQDRIVDALDAADDLVAALERLIAKKQAIKQGMMQQLLTGRTRLPGFADQWRLARLGELLAYEQPGRYLVSNADYADTGTPVLTAGKTFLLGYTSDQHGIYRDVPVIIFDDFTTASKYVDFPFKAKSSAMKMLSARSGLNLRYIYERMQLIDFVAVDHKRRWIAEYSKIEIEVPGADEQDAIAGALGAADREIGLLLQRLSKARAIKTGMMQQLLTGRTRLPAEAAS